MSNNKFLAFAAILFTLCVVIAIYLGWDSDGFYIRQVLLILAGYIMAVVINIVNEME
jgi:hypothetical protein